MKLLFSLLLSIVVVTAVELGSIVGKQDGRNILQDQAVENGLGYYDVQTGKFIFIEPDVI